jgi:phytoene desaturase
MICNRKVIIIGAGVGGLGTAIQLAKKGFDVTIFEKTSKAGGRCQQLEKEGHIFDTGPTMYLFPELFTDFFSTIGEDINKYIKLLRVDPIYQLNFANNDSMVLTSNPDKMRNQLEFIEPGSYTQYIKYLEAAKKQYLLAINSITRKNLDTPFEYFRLKNLIDIIKNKSILPHYQFTKQYFKHEHLNIAFTFQDSYISINPFTAPAVFSLFSYSELKNGNFLIEGGMYRFIEILVKIAEKQGVKIVYNCPVKKINIENNRAVSITVEGQDEIKADCIIANTGMAYTYQNLLPESSFTKKLLKKKYSCSVLSFHFAVDKYYPQLKTHNLFFTDGYKEGFQDVLDEAVPPERPHFYIQAPTRTDTSRAPKGHDTITVMVPINHIREEQPVDWNSYRNKLRKFIFARLKRIGIADLSQHIKFEVSYLPTDWKFLNITKGAVYGLNHNSWQIGYMRPKRVHSKYKNLFFTGSDTHPGSGLPTVLLSSKYTANRVSEFFKV